jgi:DNA repair protein RadC
MENLKIMEQDSLSKLKDHALLALVLSSDAPRYCSLEKASAILQKCEGSLHKLSNLTNEVFISLFGMQKGDVIRIQAMFELAKRRTIHEVLEKPKISNSKEVYQLFQHLSDCPFEEFWIVVLNKANRIIGQYRISEGGVSGTVVDIKRIFHLVLEKLGSAFILVHNHPSGNINPSENDKVITQKIVEAGKLFDIAVLDHIVIGIGYFSFADNGII